MPSPHRRRLILLTAAVFIACLSGCFGYPTLEFSDAETDGSRVRLTMFGSKAGKTQVEPLEDILNAFMRENPDILITYEGLSNEDGYPEVLLRRLSTGNADDLFMMNPYTFRTVYDSGYVGTLIEDLTDKGFLERYNDIVKPLMTVEGRVFALPLELGTFGLFVNLSLLEDSGIAAAPGSCADFLSACETLRQKGLTPLPSGTAWASILTLGRALAPVYLDGNQPGSGRFSSFSGPGELLFPGLQLMETLTAQGYWANERGSSSWEGDLDRFASGGCAFLPIPSYQIQRVLDRKPDFRCVYIGLPVADDGRVAMLRAGSPVSVSAASPHKEEALRFLSFLAQPENVAAFAEDQNAFNPLTDVQRKNPVIRDLTDLILEGRCFSDADPLIPWNLVDAAAERSASVLAGQTAEAAASSTYKEMSP